MVKKGSGWKGESRRHSLARKGIKTTSGIIDTPMYHGTKKGKFQYFMPHYSKDEQLGFGIHFTPDKEFAELYAHDPNVGGKGNNPHVYKVLLDIKNPLKANAIYDEGTKEFELAVKLFGKKLPESHHLFGRNPDKNNIRQVWLQGLIDQTSPQRAERIIRESGYDGVIYTSRLITYNNCAVGYCKVLKEVESYIVFDNDQIKIME